MRGKKNPPLDLTPAPEGALVTFDTMATAYLQDYQLQRYRSLTTARARVEHLREFFGGMSADAITADRVRDYQLHRRKQACEAATINRETSALSRMFQLAIRRGLLERMPHFPKRLEENPPRDGFFEHDEYVRVRKHVPRSYRDVLDFAYYSGWRRNEILGPRSRRHFRLFSRTACGVVAPPIRACSAVTAFRFGIGARRFAMPVKRRRSRTGCCTIVDGRPHGT